MASWKNAKTRGVRYYEHPTRRHGVKRDRYYALRYTVNGKRHEEGFGWMSEGFTESAAEAAIAKLRENHRRGAGPQTLKEQRELLDVEREKQARLEAEAERARLTFDELFHQRYIPHAQVNRRRGDVSRDLGLYRKWIGPCIGDKPPRQIVALDMERIKAAMRRAGMSPRTIEYCLAVVRGCFNYLIDHDLYEGKNPAGRTLKRPKVNNKRVRYLSQDEANRLLAELAARSRDLHDIALLSMHCGLRFGEIAALTRNDVDLAAGTLFIRDPKGGISRYAYLTNQTRAILEARLATPGSDLIFANRRGGRIGKISHSFFRAVDAIGLNAGVTDSRQKVVFHSLRHTFASRLVEMGTDIYVVQKLLGHSDLSLTSRYAHVGENVMRAAVQGFDQPSPAESAQVVPLANR